MEDKMGTEIYYEKCLGWRPVRYAAHRNNFPVIVVGLDEWCEYVEAYKTLMNLDYEFHSRRDIEKEYKLCFD